MGALADLPASADPSELLDHFLTWADDAGMTLYPAQEEAVLELFEGHHVVLETPTGSGKSLVALAGHAAALGQGRRSFYTAPIKALVSEKFFELCRVLGSDHVGMITGDASVNPEAPVICATAEILANLALREGEHAEVALACLDEFHYYADPQRGVAWQLPLLELPHTQFLLMSATLGDARPFVRDLEHRTGRPVAHVRSAVRPVPLDYEYRETLLTDTLQALLDTGRAPVYVVHFTQAAATERAQALTSVAMLDRAEKDAIAAAVGSFRFDSPFGKDLQRFIKHGIGVHHAGLLPKYRLLVEKLAQQGLLKVICGTDTLGVGVNVPIRTVLFTQLCKYDGRQTRLLTVREFQQIAGRAGRKGYDDIGFVWVQAPEHVAENKAMEAKAAADPGKRRKLVRRKAPEKGFKAWNRDTFQRLVDGRPETLESSFHVSHAMLLELLDRPGDGCGATRRLLVDNHEPRARQRDHIRRAIHLYRSLDAAGVLERLDEPDELGRQIRLSPDLQHDFRLNQPLSPFALEIIGLLDPDGDTYALDVLSVVEAVIENPTAVLLRQRDRARDELMAELKADRVPYEERMEQLAKVEWPKPLAPFLYDHFNRFAARHPWVGQDNVRPKSVARDLFERGMTFREYVNEYGIKRSEGVLLRYLADAYKGLVQTVPEPAKTDELDDLTAWLGTVVRQVDASLLEEWERLRAGVAVEVDEVGDPLDTERDAPPDVTANRRAFRVLVANELFRWVQYLARHEEDRLVGLLDEVAGEGRRGGWTVDDLRTAMAPYWDEHDAILTGPDARSTRHVQVDEAVGGDMVAADAVWRVRQVLVDPEGWGEWGLRATVDLPASRAAGRAVVTLDAIERL